MPKFGIVAEGLTDQIVIENALIGLTCDDDVEVTYVQPLNDATADGVGSPHGGWCQVLNFFISGEYLRSLIFRDFLVVHLDTDVIDSIRQFMKLPSGDRPHLDEVVACVTDLVKAEYRDRLVFAIGVDSTECWLLSLLFDRHEPKKRRKATGCFDAANRRLRKLNRLALGTSTSKFAERYNEESAPFRKLDVLLESAKFNTGLDLFVSDFYEKVLKRPRGATYTR